MELTGGIEPPTSSLPRMRSTPELRKQLKVTNSFLVEARKLSATQRKADKRLAVFLNLSKKILADSIIFLITLLY
jgi:hypothetical protein